jgi:hypothetical protein
MCPEHSEQPTTGSSIIAWIRPRADFRSGIPPEAQVWIVLQAEGPQSIGEAAPPELEPVETGETVGSGSRQITPRLLHQSVVISAIALSMGQRLARESMATASSGQVARMDFPPITPFQPPGGLRFGLNGSQPEAGGTMIPPRDRVKLFLDFGQPICFLNFVSEMCSGLGKPLVMVCCHGY